jgi:uncharacterized iron-regulated membrane protein
MRNLILNLHLYGALIGGLFIIVLGVTGSILTFQEELDHLLNPGLFNIAPQDQTLPLSAIQESLHKKYPDKTFWRYSLPQAANRPYVAQFKSTQVFINSHTGAIIGSRETPTVLDNIRTLHTSLWLGSTGRNLVTAATFLSVFLIVTGIYLWWPIRNTGTARGLSFYLHYALGIYFSLFLLALSLSGLVLAFEGSIAPWMFKVTQSTQALYNAPSTVVPGVTSITFTQALEIVSTTFPYVIPQSITIPSGPKGSYRIIVKSREGAVDYGEGWILLDQYSGKVLVEQDSHTISTGSKIMSGNGSIHTGIILGLPSKILMSLSSLILAVQTITGYCLWWKKLRRKP